MFGAITLVSDRLHRHTKLPRRALLALDVREVRRHPKCMRSADTLYDEKRKAAAILEINTENKDHGDVCRDSRTGDFFCPEGMYS